ncbi:MULTISPECIES: glycosyltransferase family 2 protein [unclassified Leptolyngbya]|uniref:glycosyltransferase family 2 protein n=1 Tax=unclassified Leptolyngbya TaxID=2650499 RepID=UPI0016877416|nr:MULTISPECIES: glycosyltransferase family 2 protein [unclassified Leptolyngbya]MBD1913104.1 glycosyltransferase family 2 protein [Leptolyngbya sp. FACHB-8]MBD2153240.1 glycosyltransferase family 2 protein [Leptolyngbya sp. FACHB-16]
MSSDKPLVSVIIPAYNAASLIERTLRSVLSQTYQNLEILVVDDGSTDQTPEVVTAIAHQDSRLQLLHQTNAGVAAARNLAIAHAQGEFVAPIDADDLWHPQAVEKLMERLQDAGDNTAVAYAWSIDIDEQDQSLGIIHADMVQGNVLKTLLCHNFIANASATLIRRRCLDQVGYYDPQLKAQNAQGCEDWDLYLRLAIHFQFAVVPEVLVGYRKVSSSMSGDFDQMARSHLLMLEQVRQKCPTLSPLLFHLSCSSFYIYFAHQCYAYGKPHKTLYWLSQALQAEPVTPLIRPGFYRLGLFSLWQIWQQREHSTKVDSAKGKIETLRVADPSEPTPSGSISHSSLFATFPLNIAQSPSLLAFLRLRLFVGHLLHLSLAYL